MSYEDCGTRNEIEEYISPKVEAFEGTESIEVQLKENQCQIFLQCNE
jgi:hypothetical protein